MFHMVIVRAKVHQTVSIKDRNGEAESPGPASARQTRAGHKRVR